jgi:hypothetical protein
LSPLKRRERVEWNGTGHECVMQLHCIIASFAPPVDTSCILSFHLWKFFSDIKSTFSINDWSKEIVKLLIG